MVKPRKNVTSLDNQYTVDKNQTKQRQSLHKTRLIRRLSFFLIFVVVISGLLISSMVTRANVLDEKKAEKSQLEEQFTTLQENQAELKNEIEKLNDDDYIAKLARRDYFLSDNGEIIFNIPETAEGTSNLGSEGNMDSSE